MSPESRDLTIDSALADPMIRAAMKADHVSLYEFEALLRTAAGRIGAAQRGGRPVIAAASLPRRICASARDMCLA